MQLFSPAECRDSQVTIDHAGEATCARLAAEAVAAGRTAVLVARDRDEFRRLRALATLFTPALSKADVGPEIPAWKQPVVAFPPGLLLHAGRTAWAPRLAALYTLGQEAPRLVVASLESLLLRYPSRDFFSSSLDIAAGSDWPQEAIIEQCMDWGYERVPMVTNPGEIARRGDILDIFAPGYARPLRIEFFGDTVEQIRLFDPESQASKNHVEEVTLIPTRPWSSETSSREAALAHIKSLYESGKLDENMAYDIRKALGNGSDALMPGIVQKDTTLFEDWLPSGAIYFTGGENDTRDAFRETYAAEAERLAGEGASQVQLVQPSVLCLRPTTSMPWNRGTVVYSEPLVIGIESSGITLTERPIRTFQQLFPDPGASDRPWLHVSEAIRAWGRDRRQVILSFASGRSRNKFLKLAEADGILPYLRYVPGQRGIYALVSGFRDGAELEWDDSIVLGETILFPRAEKAPRAKTRAFQGMDSFEDLMDGELLVHRDYGIGRYHGLRRIETDGVANDFLLVEYQGQDNLYVPVDRLSLIHRFKATEGAVPTLDRLGSTWWSTSKAKARKAIEKIAADLVEMYAYRKVAKGFRYPPAGELYREFEATFGYEETPDQAKAIDDVLNDMDRPDPMDRLVCGDVGFGKTEVAIRAAFRAASEGRQVALLCPTTVLAEQHYQTFRARMSGFPVNVALLSRFVPHDRQREVIRDASKGLVDILIGTHRILSSDIHLPNLALLILDEEQRFGVRHKESLKAFKKNVDVLTLTATPIPRTLQLSMSGIRDLSLIETAPQDRKPVATAVIQRDESTLRKVIRKELDREGQVFWVYNRVQGLAQVADYVRRLVPDARIGMAHGRMNEEEVETNMHKFWHGELDILVCTSIVESGLDFPRANTLIVDQAQNFGLGQLYQLRGRVGRSDRQAYAFFIVPDARHLTAVAEERLRIIMDMDYLGAGFKVAMEDLRLRGAGNILGEAQSGHMTRVGLDLYLEMLEQAVREIKGTPAVRVAETELTIGIPARIPETYIEDGKERLRSYKLLTGAATGQAREEVALSLRDRFGAHPVELQNFLSVLDFKQFLTELQVEKADLTAKLVKISWAEGQNGADPVRILRLANQTHGARLLPPATLVLPVPEAASYPESLQKLRAELESVRPEGKGAMEASSPSGVAAVLEAAMTAQLMPGEAGVPAAAGNRGSASLKKAQPGAKKKKRSGRGQ